MQIRQFRQRLAHRSRPRSGYYRQEGLDVQLVLIPSALGMQALFAGNKNFPPRADRSTADLTRCASEDVFTTLVGQCFGFTPARNPRGRKSKRQEIRRLRYSAVVPIRYCARFSRSMAGWRSRSDFLPVGSGTGSFFAFQAVRSIPRCFPSRRICSPKTPGIRGLVSFIDQSGSSFRVRSTLDQFWRPIPYEWRVPSRNAERFHPFPRPAVPIDYKLGAIS